MPPSTVNDSRVLSPGPVSPSVGRQTNDTIAAGGVGVTVTRGVHGNGEDWDPTGPMGFPWEWE